MKKMMNIRMKSLLFQMTLKNRSIKNSKKDKTKRETSTKYLLQAYTTNQ